MKIWIFVSIGVLATFCIGLLVLLLSNWNDKKKSKKLEAQCGPKQLYCIRFSLPEDRTYSDRNGTTAAVEVTVFVMAYNKKDAEEIARMNFHPRLFAILDLHEVTIQDSNE